MQFVLVIGAVLVAALAVSTLARRTVLGNRMDRSYEASKPGSGVGLLRRLRQSRTVLDFRDDSQPVWPGGPDDPGQTRQVS